MTKQLKYWIKIINNFPYSVFITEIHCFVLSNFGAYIINLKSKVMKSLTFLKSAYKFIFLLNKLLINLGWNRIILLYQQLFYTHRK